MPDYRVAVCEDSEPELRLISDWCREIFAEWGVDAGVERFSSASALDAAEAEPPGFDLYLLDIQLPGESGLELARRLCGAGQRDAVVFITGSAEYALEAYSVHPIHYLLKPVGREALDNALRLAWDRRRPRTLLLRCGGKASAFPAAELLYLESRSHGVVVHLSGGERFLPISLTEAERAAPADAFARCHKSYLVNLAWVAEVGRTELKLRSGETVPVSRAFYAPFQSALVRYLNR